MEKRKITGKALPAAKSAPRPRQKLSAPPESVTNSSAVTLSAPAPRAPLTALAILIAVLLGVNLLISAGFLESLNLPPAFAQAPSEASVQLSPGVLSIIYTPSDFVMSTVNISSPIEAYFSYYNNPRSLDPDQNITTRDGTALRVQDGRFKGGFELQAQVDSDYVSEKDSIPKENLGVRTDIDGLSEINETITVGSTATVAPLDSVGDYTPFTSPLVLLNATTPTCEEGRVGIYTIYPSFRLLVPNETAAGTYTTSVTYTLLEQPTC